MQLNIAANDFWPVLLPLKVDEYSNGVWHISLELTFL